jgi:hypothetical protein
LLRDNHAGYITWREYEDNQRLRLENAYMKRNCARKSARGGRALLAGLARCGRCGRMMRVFYGMRKGHAHRYQCRGDDGQVGAGLCVGGVRVDRAIALQLLDAVSDRGVEAATFASAQIARSTNDIIAAARRALAVELGRQPPAPESRLTAAFAGRLRFAPLRLRNNGTFHASEQ